MVNADGMPVILLAIAGQSWPAIIDTGFNGDLELPDSLKPAVNARYLNRLLSLLAGGLYIEEDNYEVDFPFDGQVVVAEATFVPRQDILLGTRLLQQYRLEIDFVARTVLLERVI
jgi:predicted aspartyl protease